VSAQWETWLTRPLASIGCVPVESVESWSTARSDERTSSTGCVPVESIEAYPSTAPGSLPSCPSIGCVPMESVEATKAGALHVSAQAFIGCVPVESVEAVGLYSLRWGPGCFHPSAMCRWRALKYEFSWVLSQSSIGDAESVEGCARYRNCLSGSRTSTGRVLMESVEARGSAGNRTRGPWSPLAVCQWRALKRHQQSLTREPTLLHWRYVSGER